MTRKSKKLLMRGLVSLTVTLITFGIIWISPGPVQGCYTVSDPIRDGYQFTYFHGGRVFICNEYDSAALELGSYRKEPGVGWVWAFAKYNRRVLIKPHLLYVRFTAIDGIEGIAVVPFEWRNLNFLRTHAVLASLKPLEKARRFPKTSQDAAPRPAPLPGPEK